MTVNSLLIVTIITLFVSCYSACVPTDIPCSTDCTNIDGWLKNVITTGCDAPTDCRTGLRCNGANKKQACLTTGYVKSLIDDSCIYPDCSGVDSCASNTSACTIQSFVKSALDNTCVAPTDCTTGQQCAGSFLKQACLSIGYINNNGVCQLPTIENCLESTLIPYRCSTLSTFCTGFGLVISAAVGDSSCAFPDCTAAGKCADSVKACTYKGYLKTTNNNCLAPTDGQCLDTTQNQNLCATWNNICTLKGYAKVDTNNTCKLPDCLANPLCDGTKTACTYQGFIAASANTCVKPSDCKSTNLGLCSTYKSYCKKNGYVKSATSDDCVCDSSSKESSGICISVTTTHSFRLANTILLLLLISFYL